MNAKEYLLKIRRAALRIRQLEELLAETRARAEGTSIRIKADVVQTSPSGDMLEKAVADMIDTEAKIAKQIADMQKLRLKVTNEIHAMKNDRYAEVLFRRYINLETFEHIADEMGLSFKYVLNLHGWALKAFEMVKSKQWKDVV